MPRGYPDDVGKQNFLAEVYDKERTAQLGWYFKKLAADNTADDIKSRQYEVFSRRIEAACPRPTPALVNLRKRRTDNHSTNDDVVDNEHSNPSSSAVVQLPPISTTQSRDMYDPDERVRQEIYATGRTAYLHARNRRRPESRYAFPVVSSWEYGWRLGDVIATDEIHKPPHGRCRIVADTFYRRNGLPQLG